MQKKDIQSLSFVVLLALMLVLMSRVFLPYMSVLLWSAVSWVLINPLYGFITRRMNGEKRFYELKRRILAGAFAVGTVLILAGVFFFIGFQLIGQGRIFLEEAQVFLEENPLFFSDTTVGTTIAEIVKNISMGTVDISTLDLRQEVLGFLSAYSASIVDMSKALLKNIGNFLLSLVFICFALYFFFLDASYLANLFIKAIPINQQKTRRLLYKFSDVTKNLFMGFFLVALYQAAVAFVIFSLFQVKGSLLFAVLLFFCSFIPMLGCAIVWLPLGIGVVLAKGVTLGVLFIVLCAVFISFLDNFLRPLFLKDRIKIHPLLIFFSILGGIQVFGFNGIVLGPIVIILFFTIVDMALEDDEELAHSSKAAHHPAGVTGSVPHDDALHAPASSGNQPPDA
jgi:predicted PurR-regulated permease PerM